MVNRERGNIIRLRALCAKISDNKGKLAEFISNAGKKQILHKKRCKEKVVSLRQVHFNKRKNKYCAVCMSEGRIIRQHYFQNNT